MASLNTVTLIGNLTGDPEVRFVASGDPVANFSIAINNNYTNKAGERKENVCFVRIVVWGKRAEICKKYLFKGRPVCIEGKLQSRTWEDNDGKKRSILEVVANNVQFLGEKPSEGSEPNGNVRERQDTREIDGNSQSELIGDNPPF